MKNILAVLALVFTIASVSYAYQDLTPEQLLSMLASNDSLILVDVRESGEFDSGHIAGAHLYPLNSALIAGKYRELPVGFPLAFYCGSGFRSAQAVAFMDTAGSGSYKGKVFNLTGGLGNWPYTVVTGGQDGPDVRIEPDSLFFGEVAPGNSTANYFTIANTANHGTAVVLVPSLETQGFSVPADTVVMLPGDSIRVDVTFHPSDETLCADTVFVSHGGAGRDTIAIVLRGSGAVLLTGDIDANGVVNIFDLLALLKELSGQPNNGVSERMDLNGDNVLNIFDLLRLLFIIRA